MKNVVVRFNFRNTVIVPQAVIKLTLDLVVEARRSESLCEWKKPRSH